MLPWRSRIRLEEARSRKKSFLHILLILMTSVSLCRVVSLCVLLVELFFLGTMPLAFKETELKKNYSLPSIRFQDLLITWYMNSINQYIQILLSRSTLHFKCKFFFLFVSLYCCNRFHLILYICGIFGNQNSMLDLLRRLRTYEPWKIFIAPFIEALVWFINSVNPCLYFL